MNKENLFENEMHEEEVNEELLEGEFEEDYDFEDFDDEDYEEVEDFREIILTLDDDSELKCLVVAQYQVDEQDYIALLPVEDEVPGDILLYRASYNDDEETFDVSMIEDEKEFELAAEAYYQFVDENKIEIGDFDDHDHDHDHCGCGHDHDHHHHHDHNHE